MRSQSGCANAAFQNQLRIERALICAGGAAAVVNGCEEPRINGAVSVRRVGALPAGPGEPSGLPLKWVAKTTPAATDVATRQGREAHKRRRRSRTTMTESEARCAAAWWIARGSVDCGQTAL